MTAARPADAPAASRLARSRPLLWAAFILAHLWLGFLNLEGPGLPFGDVDFVYKAWAEQAASLHYYVGINGPWVYPIVAILPILGSAIFGFARYSATWLSMVFLLDCVAFAAMVGWRRPGRSFAIGWWWIAFLLLLGPIAVGRLDSITVPPAIVGVLLLAQHPRATAVLLTVATWVKVWPAALIAAVLIAAPGRRRFFGVVLGTSVAIIVIALAFGSGTNVFSFVSQQTGRGLQIEAPVSSIWMWMAAAHVPGMSVYYDLKILTYQVSGPGSSVAAAVMTPIFGAAAIAVAVLGIVAVRRRAAVTELLPALMLAFITAFFAFNKVGSPQYMTWLAAPVILGIATHASGHGRSFRMPAALVLVAAGLTQLIYPYNYDAVLELNPFFLSMLSLRNVLLFVILAWAVREVWRAARSGAQHEHLAPAEAWLPSFWPFVPSAPEPAPARTPGDRAMLDDRFAEGE